MTHNTRRNVVSGFSRTIIVGLFFLGLTPAAIAHHSFAMYDMQKSQSMTGKLTRFIPGGNHAQLVFEVLGDDGKPMTKDGKVFISYEGRDVATLKGAAVRRFLERVVDADEDKVQLALTKATGNFKRGNER